MISRRTFVQRVGGAIAVPTMAELLAACNTAKQRQPIVFASPAPVWWNAVPLLADQRKAFDKLSNLRVFEVPTGVRSKDSVVDGNADVGVSAPNALSITSEDKLSGLLVLGSMMQSSSTVAIVTRTPTIAWDRVRVGYVKGTISEFYLISYLRATKALDQYVGKKIQLVSLPPTNVAPAFSRKDIDVAVVWEPFATIAQLAEQSTGAQLLRTTGLYQQHIFAITSKKAYQEKKREVDEFVATLEASARSIEQDRPRAAAELEKYFNFTSGFIASSEVWKDVKFAFTRDKDALRAALLQDHELARIAGIAGSVDTGALVGTLAVL